MSPIEPEVLSCTEAEKRRSEILSKVGDERSFRRRGERFELNADELALYDDLCELDYLLGE